MTAAPGHATFRPDIQGLRAIAVVAVVLYHFALPWTPGGFVGVDMFFVISGFLVGGGLMAELHARGAIDVPSFFARRARRIIPAALVTITAVLVASLMVLSPARLLLWDSAWTNSSVVKDAIASVLYVPNLWFAQQGNDYLADDSLTPFLHFWSLGIEEQFYIVTPLLLVTLWLLLRRRFTAVVVVIAVLTVASFAYGLYLADANAVTAFYHPAARAWELGAGLLLAVAIRTGWVTRSRVVALTFAALGAAGLLWAIGFLDTSAPWPGVMTLAVVAFTCMVIWAGASQVGPWSGWSFAPLTYVGDRSYSIYLWHWPVWVLALEILGREPRIREWLVLVALTLVLSELSYRFVEMRFRTAPVSTRPQRTRIFAATTVAAIAVLAIAAVVPVAATARYGGSGVVAEELPSFEPSVDAVDGIAVPSPPEPLEFATAVPDNVNPVLQSIGDDKPVSYGDDCHLGTDEREQDLKECIYGDSGPLVALYGDSHMAQWLPALMPYVDSGEIRILAVTASSCAAVPGVYKSDEENCGTWRENAMERLNEEQPDLILMSSYVDPVTGGYDERIDLWTTGVEELLTLVPEDAPIVYIADTAIFEEAPAQCVARDVRSIERCEGDLDEVMSEYLTEPLTQAFESAGHTYADFTPYFCTGQRCGLVTGNVFIYRDNHHITTVYAERLGPVLMHVVNGALDAD